MESQFTSFNLDTVEAKTAGIPVEIERHCLQKMFGWCRATNNEVSGRGLVRLKDGRFTVYDVFLPLQYGAGGYTELDDFANGKLNYWLFKNKKKTEDNKFWWHTHPTFGVFWSGTDNDNAQRQAREGNGGWGVSLVINQKGEYRCRLDFVKPFDIMVDDLDIIRVPNSRKRKRKRNFKSDVKKWCLPLSEMPERQKPKPVVIKTKDIIKTDEFDWTKWKPELDQEVIEGNKLGSKRGPEIVDSRVGRATSLKDKYIIHNGRFMSMERYNELNAGKCWCADGDCWECREKKEKKDVITEVVDDTLCSCLHTGQWELCICGANCNKCLEVAEESGRQLLIGGNYD